MRTVIISSAPFVRKSGKFHAYSPYIKEMAIWAKHSDEVAFSCPIWKTDRGLLASEVTFPLAHFFELKDFNVRSFTNLLRAAYYAVYNFYIIFKAMRWADHIHLRCPGNIGLMACMAQIFFPNKIKTAKYAGNWDPKSNQPLSYRMQKWLLNSTILTKNMTVLVYGKWEGTSKNIKPFFTASYRESDKVAVLPRNLKRNINFLFVGALAKGKRPMYAIRLVEKLRSLGIDAWLEFYGDGLERNVLQEYIARNNLHDFVTLHGNQNEEIVRNAYQKSHFMVLPSESEGWPKVVAEAMFWGCLPISSAVSCVPYMLDFGNRGLLLEMIESEDAARIQNLIKNPAEYNAKVAQSISWSRQFTLDLFEMEIKALLGK